MHRRGIMWEPFGRPQVSKSIPKGSEEYRKIYTANRRLIEGYAELSQSELSSVMRGEAAMETELKIALIGLKETIDNIESIMEGTMTLANKRRMVQPLPKGGE